MEEEEEEEEQEEEEEEEKEEEEEEDSLITLAPYHSFKPEFSSIAFKLRTSEKHMIIIMFHNHNIEYLIKEN